MARFAGTAGEVTVAGASATGIKSWTLDLIYAALETTAFDSVGVSAFIPGKSAWSGSFEGLKVAAPLTIGTEIALVLKETQTATQKFTGQAIVTGLHAKTDIEGLVTYGYDFQGTAALTIPTT